MEVVWKQYVYIDDKRVSAYYDQITDTDLKAACEGAFFAILPAHKAAEEQSPMQSLAKAYSLYEKAVAVHQSIKSCQQYRPSRHHFGSRGRDAVYYEEQTWLQRVSLNQQTHLWIATNSCDAGTVNKKQFGHLILLEDYAERDDGHVWFNGGWHTAHLLSWYGKLRLIADGDTEGLRLFGQNPVTFLETKGLVISKPKKMNVLYRVLATCHDLDNCHYYATLGYPILISEGA